ncbi:MAG: SIR2 family protein, partial [Planctomycetota bacterium]
MGQSINDVGDFRFTTDKNEFLRLIIEDANLGRTFVPFIGSGLSSPSGIIMGMEFTNYLAFTMYLVLCDPKKRKPTHGEGISERWNLILQGWPPLPSRPEVSTAKTWIKKEFDGLCKEFKLRSSYDDKQQIQMLVPESGTQINDVAIALTQPPIPMILRSWHAKAEQDRLRQLRGILKTDGGKDKQFTSPHWKRSNQSFHDVIVESGLRALSDWRETLEFLSRVVIDEHGLRMGDPNPSIIDDFNSTITRDKRPNLGHKMLAHLSEPLRISTLLTTNFDTLMEEAYRSLSLPLTVLPVSAKGELPNQRTAGSCDSLIKLHGESHDTRADLSLDDEPSAEDKATFLAYMQRGTGHLLPRKPVNPLPDRTSRLLVVGYSGSDHRCVQMIKHWLEHSTDQPRAYWICFSESDQKRIEELFASSSFDGQIKTVLTARPDLLLYELYQKLQFCLPPGGLTYEFTHILPPERIRNFDHRPDQVSEILHKASKTQESYTLVAKHNKRLLRDAIVQDVCNEMLYSVNNKEFGQKESHFINKAPWYPLYKLGDDIKKLPDDPDVQSKARELKKNSYAHHPTMIDCAGGVVRASALAANKLAQEHSRKVFWIELQDYLDTDSLLRDFLRSLALRCGYF